MPQKKTRAAPKVNEKVKSKTTASDVDAVKAAATGRDENANGSPEKVLLLMRQIFDRAQDTSIHHAQLSERLKEVYDSNRQRFVEAFLVVLRSVLVQQETNKFALLLCDFIASFISSVNDEEEDDGLFRCALKLLLKSYDATGKQVRFFCCLLVGKLLARRSDATEMDASVCSAIESRMLDRLADRSTHVRIQAIHALARLQDPQRATECPVISALTRVLRSDPRFEVRRAALERIVVCRSTLSALLHRLNDASEQVRRVAYGVLAERLNVAVLTPKRRVFVLRAACMARSPLVTDAARRCFEIWERKAELSAAKKVGSEQTSATSPPVFGLVELLRRFDLFDAEESTLVERMVLLMLDGAKSERRAALIEAIRCFLDDSNLPIALQPHADASEAGSLPAIEALVLWRVLVAHLKTQVDKYDADKRKGNADDDMASVSTAPDMTSIGRQFYEDQLESISPNPAIFSDFIDRVLDDLVSGAVYGLSSAAARAGEPTFTMMASTMDPSVAGQQTDVLDRRFDAVRRGMLAVKQLLLVLESCGEALNEEGTRRRVRDLLYLHALRDRRIVLYNDGELTGTLIRLARRIESRESHFIAQIGEAIAELRRPTDLSANALPSVSVVLHREETLAVDATQPADGTVEQPPTPQAEVLLTAPSIVAGPNQPLRAVPPLRAEERRRRSATLSDQLVKIADTKLRLNELREALNTAVTKQDFEAAGNLKRQLLETEQMRDELVAEFERMRRVDVNEDIVPGGAAVNAAGSDNDGVTPAKRMAMGVNTPGVGLKDQEKRTSTTNAAIRDSESEADTETETESDADPTLTDTNEPDADGELVALNADGEMDIEAERARQRESVRGQLMHDAMNKKRKLNEASDPETLAACLTILRDSLIHTRMRVLHATLRALADSLVLGCVSNADATVRRLAFHCLALSALMDAELARRHFVMFVQAYRLDSDELKLIAMQFIFDAVCLFGPQPFGLPVELQISKRPDASIIEDDDDADTLTTSAAQPPGADSETPGTQLYASLVRYLREPDAKLSSVAAEGLSKLMLNNRLVCADAFCALFLIWFDATALLNSVSRQAVATFIQTYAYCSPECQMLVGMYSVTTLRRAMRRARDVAIRRAKAEDDENDEELDADDPNWDPKTIDGMADLLVRLTDTRLRYVQHKLLVDYDDNPGHDCLCECVWNEIAKKRSDSQALRTWTRILSQVSLSALRRSAFDVRANQPPTVLEEKPNDEIKQDASTLENSSKLSTTGITVEQRVNVYRRWMQQARTVQKLRKQDKKVVHYLSTHIAVLEHRLRAFAVLTGDTTQQSEASSVNPQLDNVANAVQEMQLDNSEGDESSASEAESTSSEQD